MKSTLPIAAIENGIVIDHLRPGNALKILRLFHLLNKENCVMLGLNLPSHRLGKKDLIKLRDMTLTKEQASEILIFSKDATINLIQSFKVIEKIHPPLPKKISGIFTCQNKNCISLQETAPSLFEVKQRDQHIFLCCHYCNNEFTRDDIE